MKTIGFYGKSGTGKSYHAMDLAHKLGIELLIDDGLLISGNSVLAGNSAKREKTRLGAVRTALFTDETRAREMREKIREEDPNGILILGTSPDMIDKIAERLELPAPSEYIAIEDVTTRRERDVALKNRRDKGTHVIPAPTLEIKRQFSGYFMDPLSLIRDLIPGRAKSGERTLVRPTYSYRGEYSIADSCLTEIVTYAAKTTDGVARVSRILIDPGTDSVALSLSAVLTGGVSVPVTAQALQRNVRTAVEEMTAFNISGVRVDVRGYQ
ncbi:MAG: Asp23/Gls24 family envelope stress response protein [Firmicutes bacterium]|nr:Asp23/Gls24 family envelope stress response protein [Bacillota bacterium]